MSRFAIVWEDETRRTSLSKYISRHFTCRGRDPARDIIAAVTRGVAARDTERNIFNAIINVLYRARATIRTKDTRGDERVQQIVGMLPTDAPPVYVDFGCGDASITDAVAAAVGAQTVYGVDIMPVDPSAHINYCKTLGEVDNPCNFMTAMMSLHHVDAPAIVTEIARVMPRGTLILREHDFDGSESLRAYLDLVHIFAEILRDPEYDPATYPHTDYLSRDALDAMLRAAGFELVSVSTYGVYNPQAIYHARYDRK